jgi:hypothetical protein
MRGFIAWTFLQKPFEAKQKMEQRRDQKLGKRLIRKSDSHALYDDRRQVQGVPTPKELKFLVQVRGSLEKNQNHPSLSLRRMKEWRAYCLWPRSKPKTLDDQTQL